ncbi:TauD/TfdA family dioxygenase [Novosphingobium sp. 1949]|uniref:TauD/TfdA family dioxygenase n=1 Tax=Novosphingobium organovorum TaxID=2930092 RepID=A0ABT0BET0_9SPHN|nr:TauD/TfdA family dioxygenase [Novosphingobium organovorum]MCJ2183552.1 TauD/TfdA family dioxygenase [Novosphingobium organovorum]
MTTSSIATYANAPDPASGLDIRPVTGTIGAEVRGVTLSGDLGAGTIAAIKAALVRHKVLFFRAQHSLDDAAHEAFAAHFGDPVAHPTVPVAPGSRYLLELDSKEGYAASSWHTDVTFTEAYPAASILRAITIPEAGGDTVWANCVTAYDTLPEALRPFVNGLRAVHSNDYDYAALLASTANRVASDAQADARRLFQKDVFASTIYETEHPVVRVHPVSGERALLLGHFVKRIAGLGAADSARIFAILQEHITRPENVVRWRWQPGDVAFWDNQATQHRAVADFGLQRRTLRRATIAGAVPVGIDGSRSQTLRKERPLRTQAA